MWGKTARLTFILFLVFVAVMIVAYALIFVNPTLAIGFSFGMMISSWGAGITFILFLLFMIVPGLKGR